MDTKKTTNQECCPKFDPMPWDGKILDWNNKKFVKDTVFTLFYMPLNFGSVMRKLDAKVRGAGASFVDAMSLSDHTSKWKMDLYVAVDKEVLGVENAVLSGKFFSKVYEGDFKDTGTWLNDYENIVKDKGMSVRKNYMWYTTCPTCAKKWGKNYVVIIGEVE